MRTIKTPTYPSNLLFFDTETRDSYKGPEKGVQQHRFWFGCLTAYRIENEHRSRDAKVLFTTIDQFWQWVIRRLDTSRPLWCFAHNLGFDLTILDAWNMGDKYGITVDLPVLDDPPVFLCCTHKAGKVNFVDTFNYWKASVEQIGSSFGLAKLPMPKSKKVNNEWRDYCQRDVDIIDKAVFDLIQWLRTNDLGPLTYTIASIAMATYKHRFMPANTIYVHDNQEILYLERCSYHGGLTHPYFIGPVKTHITKLDVNSLYPTVMLEQYPVKVRTHTSGITVSELRKQSKQYGCLAMVEIVSDKRPYPVYRDGRLLEGVGHFSTPLCGPELMEGVAAGDVVSVKSAVFYSMADIFTQYVNYFYRQRKSYKEKGDKVNSDFCKILLNSLYGKFGQHSIRWTDLTYDRLAEIYSQAGLTIPPQYEDSKNLPVIPWGNSRWTPIGLTEALTLRNIAGSLQYRITEGEHHESCPIIAAYVTSYARSYMRHLSAIAGHKHVYYCDTDSLFVDDTGLKRLKNEDMIDSNKLGKLKIEGETDRLVIHGPKDYLFGNERVIKGVRKTAIEVSEGVFEQEQFEHLKSVLNRAPEPYIEIKKVQKHLKREYRKGTISASGWTEYPLLTMEDQT